MAHGFERTVRAEGRPPLPPYQRQPTVSQVLRVFCISAVACCQSIVVVESSMILLKVSRVGSANRDPITMDPNAYICHASLTEQCIAGPLREHAIHLAGCTFLLAIPHSRTVLPHSDLM